LITVEEDASIGIMQLISDIGTKELINRARLIQDRIRNRNGCGGDPGPTGIRIIGGADASYAGEYGVGVLALLSFPGLEPIGHAFAGRIPLFPYIPGLFAFRELPLLLSAFEKLPAIPDLLFVNGHGYSHPKRFGIACHAGAVLDVPTIGIASHPLAGHAATPGPTRGSCAPIKEGEEVLGMAVRTKDQAKPVYVSAGYRTSLLYAVRMVLDTSEKNRIPVPIQAADSLARQYRDLFGYR